MLKTKSKQKRLKKSTLKEKTAQGLLWGGVSNILQQCIGMGFGIVIARILTPDDYGLIAMLAIFSAIAVAFIDGGFSYVLIKKKNLQHRDCNAVFWFSALMGLGIYLLLFFAAPLIAKFYKQPELLSLSRLLFLGFLVGCIGNVHVAIMLKNMMTKQIGIINIFAVLSSGIAGLLMAVNGYAYWGLVVQQLAHIVIAVFLRWYFSPWRPTFQFDFSPLRNMIGFSLKLFLTNIIVNVNTNLSYTLMGKFYGKTSLGYYSQGYKWVSTGSLLISGMLNMVTAPLASQVNDDAERQLRVVRKMLRFTAFVAFPVFMGLVIIAKDFIGITLGDKWLPSIPFMQIICIWGLCSTFITLFVHFLLINDRSSTYLYGNLIFCSIQMLVLLLVYCLGAGIIYFAAGFVATSACSAVFWYIKVQPILKIKNRQAFVDVFPYFTVSGFSALAAWLATNRIDAAWLSILLKIILMPSCYFAVLRLFNSVMLKETVEMLKNQIKPPGNTAPTDKNQ
ncbi:MAG: lipopolysaccharide biosynthesis protein [Prevotellaceae bacterium]|jgi:O-antigen/teichoic acid export membrane protein|nr:lipopolysaccharide biosynthesis protein [Prevotellaceae bacterium]